MAGDRSSPDDSAFKAHFLFCQYEEGRTAINHLGRNPIFSSPKPSMFSEAELLHNWFDSISGEMEGALAPFGEACSGSLVFFSPPGQDSTL